MSSSWPRVQPLNNSGMAPIAPSAESAWRSYGNPSRDYEELSLKINPPSVVFDNTSDPVATVVKVDSANRHGCLLMVVQILTDLDLAISKAYISSDGGWFVDVFHVTDQLGRKLSDPNVMDYIKQTLGAKREASVREVKTCTGKPVGSGFADCNAIELTGRDRPGLLSDIATALTHLSCNVVGAEVWTHNRRVACVVYVSDAQTGRQVLDDKRMTSIKAALEQVMQSSDSKTSFAEKHTHTERRLHQMMFADRDFDFRKMEGMETARVKPTITVRNCGETMYSIVHVKCEDRPKLLFDTVCTLTDMQYMVYHAEIGSEDGLATQEYYIRHMDGATLDSEAERNRVITCLEAAIERRAPEGVRLELCTSDRVGLLSDVTRVFRENNLSITSANVSTRGAKAVNEFYVSDASGKPVDMKVIELMRRKIGPNVLHAKNIAPVAPPSPPRADESSFSLAGMLRSQSERFLTSIGLSTSTSSAGS